MRLRLLKETALWTPKENAQIFHIINRMLLASESTEDRREGCYRSYLEMYILGLKQAGFRSQGIQNFVSMLHGRIFL